VHVRYLEELASEDVVLLGLDAARGIGQQTQQAQDLSDGLRARYALVEIAGVAALHSRQQSCTRAHIAFV
jgi:hypothetical protein